MAQEAFPFSTDGDVTIGTSWTDIPVAVRGSGGAVDNLQIGGRTPEITATLKNTGGSTLNDFRIRFKSHADDDWHEWLSTTPADDFTSTDDGLPQVSTTTPLDLAASGSSWFKINTRSIFAIQFQGKMDSGSTTVTINGQAGGE